MKATVYDKGDPSVGIFPQTWEVDCPFDTDVDDDSREYFRIGLLSLYKEFTEGRLSVDFEDEKIDDDE